MGQRADGLCVRGQDSNRKNPSLARVRELGAIRGEVGDSVSSRRASALPDAN